MAYRGLDPNGSYEKNGGVPQISRDGRVIWSQAPVEH